MVAGSGWWPAAGGCGVDGSAASGGGGGGGSGVSKFTRRIKFMFRVQIELHFFAEFKQSSNRVQTELKQSFRVQTEFKQSLNRVQTER